MDRIPMTSKGYRELCEKLRYLKEKELPRLEKAIAEAREMGDLSENAEFDAAREEMWRVNEQISESETKLASVEVIDPSQVAPDEVCVGRVAVVKDLDRDRPEEVYIVGDGERWDGVLAATPFSPLGEALMGHKVGDRVQVQVPRGIWKLEIVGVKPIPS